MDLQSTVSAWLTASMGLAPVVGLAAAIGAWRADRRKS